MILSRLELDPRSRDVIHAVRDPHKQHVLVMRGFAAVGANARSRLGVLHRLDHDGHDRYLLSVQSRDQADWSTLPAGTLRDTAAASVVTTGLDEQLLAVASGALIAFRLRANVTRRIDTKSGPDGKRRHGKRVPLRDCDARIAWLVRKGGAAGFGLVQGALDSPEVRMTEETTLVGIRGQSADDPGARVTVESVRFDGILRVVDAVLFRNAVEAGIGPGRAYGCGLLSFRIIQ